VENALLWCGCDVIAGRRSRTRDVRFANRIMRQRMNEIRPKALARPEQSATSRPSKSKSPLKRSLNGAPSRVEDDRESREAFVNPRVPHSNVE
jgi:hypothetical protein